MRQRTPEFDEIEAARLLLEFMTRRSYRPLLQREILHHAQVPGPERVSYRRVLRNLIRRGTVRKVRGGRLVAAGPGGEDRGSLVDGRGHKPVLGVFLARGKGGVVQPLEPGKGQVIRVPPHRGLRDLEAVSVEIVEPPRGGNPALGKIVESLGQLDEPGTDVKVVVRKYGLAEGFPDAVREEARRLPKTVGPREAAGRERFDAPGPVTIDGEGARDFDDAILVEERPRGGFRLYVHIADVAHFVRCGTPLDLEARARGTSVYFPEKVVPMLPEELSNELCSLVPGQDRLVQSVIIDFTKTGKRGQVRFADGVIRSAARLTYTEVAALLEGRQKHGVPASQVAMLRTANRLREALEQRRHARGSIDFDLPAPQILLDVEGAMTGITVEPRNLAHRLIEDFMIAANEAVADHLSTKGADALYRVHDAPDPVKLEALGSFVEHFGFELHRDQPDVASRDIQKLIESTDGRPEARVISQVALRTMSQARYSTENAGHFALAAPSYGHFTSPIRRYPDLIVHRQLRALRRSEPAPHDHDALVTIAETSSTLERGAESAERELLSWKKVAFIADHVGESFEGIVTGVTRFGLFVQLIENLVEGLVRVELLGSEWFDFDERRFELVGSRSGTTYRLGDSLRVQVTRVDRVLQRVDFVPQDGTPTPTPAPRHERQRRQPRFRSDRRRTPRRR